MAISLTIIFLAALAAAALSGLAFLAARRSGAPAELLHRLALVEQAVGQMPGLLREEMRGLREELQGALGRQTQGHETRFTSFSQEIAHGQHRHGEAIKAATDSFAATQATRLSDTSQQMRELRERLELQAREAQAAQTRGLEGLAQRIEALTIANGERQDQMRQTLTASLDQLRQDNEAKLEQMRLTVDEKLQGTLEKRLGESFQIVSDRLELVHKGLGEMQTLATGVGDLKRVLTNVKSRGGWGEVQLGALLEDMLTPEQFASNVAVQPGSAERVDFAVRLPGRGDDDSVVHLPIDAKFPQEDYERLLAAQESGAAEEIEARHMALERAVKLQAKSICAKYVHPPHTTNFAILYLPTEGLFAEVIRRPGLISELQQQHQIMVTGPTTLAAILNSLQMGFRSVAIEKRSSEVWKVLGAAKAEFRKYGDVWDKVAKQLETAQKTVSDAGVRTRVLERRLRDVETLDGPDTEPVPLLTGLVDNDDAEAA